MNLFNVYASTYTLRDLITDNTITFIDDYTYQNPYQNRSIAVGDSIPYILSGISSGTIVYSVSNYASQYSNGTIAISFNNTPTTLTYDGSPYSSDNKSVRYYGSDTTLHTVNFTYSNNDGSYFSFSTYRTGGSTASQQASYDLTIHSITLDGVNVLSDSTDNSSGYTTIETGNIVYFDLGSGISFDIDLESQFYSNSGVVSGTWTDDNRRYGFSSELPAADTNFGETAGSGILWTKSTKGQNILGQTKIGDANITGTTTAKYLWIINPMYNNKYFEDSLDAKALNGLITVTGVPAGTTVYTYKLKQNASSIGLESTIPDVSGGTGTVSDITGTQTTYVSTDDNETPYTQTVGGDNSAPDEVTATEGIRQTLDQLSNSFSTLFLAPVEYIQNLISSGSAFMQTLGGIFSWLPEPVVSVFLSALVLMIVIGVIKMLL